MKNYIGSEELTEKMFVESLKARLTILQKQGIILKGLILGSKRLYLQPDGTHLKQIFMYLFVVHLVNEFISMINILICNGE